MPAATPWVTPVSSDDLLLLGLLVLAAVSIGAVVYLLVNLLVDLSYALVDPRVLKR